MRPINIELPSSGPALRHDFELDLDEPDMSGIYDYIDKLSAEGQRLTGREDMTDFMTDLGLHDLTAPEEGEVPQRSAADDMTAEEIERLVARFGEFPPTMIETLMVDKTMTKHLAFRLAYHYSPDQTAVDVDVDELEMPEPAVPEPLSADATKAAFSRIDLATPAQQNSDWKWLNGGLVKA